MTNVLEKCEELLLTMTANMDHLVIAEEYNLPRLLDKCIDYASHKPLHDLETKHEFQKLEQTTLIELLRRKVRINLSNCQCRARVAQMQSVRRGAEKSWVRNALEPTGFSVRQEN